MDATTLAWHGWFTSAQALYHQSEAYFTSPFYTYMKTWRPLRVESVCRRRKRESCNLNGERKVLKSEDLVLVQGKILCFLHNGTQRNTRVHEWDDGEVHTCGFHQNTVCSCNNCGEEEELQCKRKPYKTKIPLTCDYHWLAYRIECERRAEDAANVIHPTMGRGHSNLCEAHFTVLPDFRSKDQSLCR